MADICDNLSDQTNGSISISTDGNTTTATYACDSGYSLSGTAVVECMSDGTWQLEEPTCGILFY